MEQFENDKQELIGILESVKRNIKFLSQTVGERRRVAVNESERNLEDARKLLRKMEATASVLPQQNSLRVQVNQYERQVNELEKNLLVAMPSSPAMGASDNSLFLDTYARVEKSGKSLERTEAKAYESEQIGAAIMTDLHSQRERLEVVDSKLSATDAIMDRASSKLKRMYWRVVSSRFILISIIIVEILIIICMVFFRWIIKLL